MLGTITVKLRPIKIAFLVDPKDKKAVLEAIKINSFLWGGTFNPIIPLAKRIPAVWKKADEFITFKNTAKTIASGYIDAYDPDYFAVLGDCDIKPLNLDKDRIISASDILAGVDSDGTPSYGVGLFELLRYFIDQELKFARKRPLNIYFTDLDNGAEMFLASVFGKLPTKIDKTLKQNYRDHLEAKDQKVEIDNYAEFLNPWILFPRRLASLYIDARPSRKGLREGCIFFLDAENTYDIIDYWNLRAMAWPIIPVPRQAATSEAAKHLARDFIEERFGQSRSNPDIFYNTTIMKSRSVDEKEVQTFIKSLDIPRAENPHAFKFVFQPWYPRIWDEWARDKDDVDGCELEAGEASYEFSETDTRINAKTVDPKFVARFGGRGEPRFANTLEFHIYGGKELMAQVIPAGAGMDMVRAIGGMASGAWRFSRRELVHLVEHPNWSIYVSVPIAKEVFSGWMKSLGWEVTLSSPGNIAYQMTRRLGGAHGLSILSHENILNLLRKMENGKVVSKEEFTAEIAKTANQNRILRDRTRITERLLESGMIRLGAEFQCPSCQ